MKSLLLLILPAVIMRSASALVCGVVLVGSPAAAKAAPSAAREWNEQLLAAIRFSLPHPPAHARNLFHTAVAIYNAWAAYDTTAVGYLYNEKAAVLQASPVEVELARREAISYAAYRVLRSRFATGPGSGSILAAADAKLTALGYSTATGQAPLTTAPTPSELGKRIGDAILTWGAGDGYALTACPQTYNAAVNPNIAVPLAVLGENYFFMGNMPLGYGIPATTDPNFWQPLALSLFVTANGEPLPGNRQTFAGVQSLAITPFSLTRTDPLKPWLDLFGGPSRLSVPGAPAASDAAYKANAMDVLRKSAKLNDPAIMDISPGTNGNNPSGADSGTGYPVNPVTGQPWGPNAAVRSDFVRVMAEYWADGPNSETPPGHWHALANEVADSPALVKRVGGTGPVRNDLEWDVKTYFCLAAATHDAVCAAWSLKRYYSGPRPITMIRYMGSKGQSSNPDGPSYHPQGLPLEDGVVEVITADTAAPGGKHERIFDLRYGESFPGTLYIGKVAVFSWPGEHPENLPAPSIATHQSVVRWQLAEDWLPFQRKTYNTPAFPGSISGQSTVSRAAAEALTLLTGSPYFPGGLHHHTVRANSMQIDLGPGADVDLQWCAYADAADQAGQAHRWGGLNSGEDDYRGRLTGSLAGKSAFALAEKYWTGTILSESPRPVLAFHANGSAVLTWTPLRGRYHKVQTSTDLSSGGWTDATSAVLYRDNAAVPGDPVATYTDPSPSVGRKFYRVIHSAAP